MQYLSWICWLFSLGLPGLTAYPVPLINHAVVSNDHVLEWGYYWLHYTIGFLTATVTILTLVGCLCCYKHRPRNGFQAKPDECKQEFKDGNSNDCEPGHNHSITGLELSTQETIPVVDKVQFEPLPVDLIVSGKRTISTTKPLPLSTSFYEERDAESATLQELCHEWFDKSDLYVPREKLKYLREIGRGWFGKVVEGQADLDNVKDIPQNGGVVVRILTEEATTKEKVWFLGEARPYLRLRHRNILTLYGFCLETDPYLLLFESCPKGDVKGFLLSNHDKKFQETLEKENIPIRMALDIAAGLNYMHSHAFVHTDLAARNCLVASDLSVKLGDYGTAVEKYAEDYYVLSDRALPIRWSAPESIECTDTTIETREITAQANIWSYGILLWEIVMWGERPFNNMSDEQVIQMLLSAKTNLLSNDSEILQIALEQCSSSIHRAIRFCINLNPSKRPNLSAIEQLLLNEHADDFNFEPRWTNSESNTFKQTIRSASLQDLRGSIDSDYWTTIVDDTTQQVQPFFRLELNEPVKNVPTLKNITTYQKSDSETEEESWKGRVEQGVYTEKVKQKSKSVTDLMVLVHIDFDSDADLSMEGQMTEKCSRKKFPATGSDSDLRHNTYSEEFNETLRKLRDPLPSTTSKIKLLENTERPKLLTLTMDQTQMPILRLALDTTEKSSETAPINSSTSPANTNKDSMYTEKHVLRLLSKGDPNLPVLRYVPDIPTSEVITHNESYNTDTLRVNHVPNGDSKSDKDQLQKDVELWNHSSRPIPELEQGSFNNSNNILSSEATSKNHDPNETSELMPNNSTSDCPITCGESSAYIVEEDFSNSEDLCVERKCLASEEDEERKHLSTPDDEQSSDSGFRDKESCEEEENVYPPSHPTVLNNLPTTTTPSCTEDDQLRVLLELDTILDAECYASFSGASNSIVDVTEHKTVHQNGDKHDLAKASTPVTEFKSVSPDNPEDALKESCIIAVNKEDEKEDVLLSSKCETAEQIEDRNIVQEHKESENSTLNIQEFETHGKLFQTQDTETCEVMESSIQSLQENEQEHNSYLESQLANEQDHDDEDSSTMSLRSDNSYMSFGIDEEFVTAIKNELREKLPCAQTNVIEPLEPLEMQDDDNPSTCSDVDIKQWEDEENDESCNQGTGGIGISIRYNVYGTPLSPILEERESTANSESLITNSIDVSVASKDSSEDVLLVDTKTSKIILLEGSGDIFQEDDRDTTNGDLSEDENLDYTCSLSRSCDEKPHIVIPSGGAPLPSPEEESKWQQLPPSFPLALPLQLQDDLISTSFATAHGWGRQGEDDDEEDLEDDEELDEDNSSSSGEFIWKSYDKPRAKQMQNNISTDETASSNVVEELNTETEEGEEEQEDEDEEEEFIPSAWNATLAPHRSALRSPDKTLKAGDQKKSVWFKKQRYHCVYEYPKETSTGENHSEPSNWEPTTYADWEGMMDESRIDVYPSDYSDINHIGNEEFFVSSSNRPFQFPVGDAKYVSQFFPGATSTPVLEQQNAADLTANRYGEDESTQDSNVHVLNDYGNNQQHRLGQLRHTRDRLKLNFLSANGTRTVLLPSVQQIQTDDNFDGSDDKETESKSVDNVIFEQDEANILNMNTDSVLPKVPQQKTEQAMNLDATSLASAEYNNYVGGNSNNSANE